MGTLTIREFLKRLKASDLLTEDELADVVRQAEQTSGQDPQSFVKQLVVEQRLTAYQAKKLWKNQGPSLSLGKYIIVDELGRGGMGVVLKAVHRRMQREVAVKVLPAAMVKDQAAIARFQREVVAAAQLSHPNIVSAFDANEIDGQHILVIEFVDGRDLASVVKKNGPLSLEQTIDCVIQTARGLDYAHGQGVIHRDIKPANLLLDSRGAVKILDMGLARFSDSANVGEQAELTGTGAVMGTVDYMSPEQALSTKSADARSDIYSLGITLYFLLTGKPAYSGESLMSRLLAHANDPIPSLRDARPDATENIQAVFEKMVAKKAEDRYQSMAEIITDLDTCRTDQSGTVLVASAPVTGGENTGDLSAFLSSLESEEAERGPVNRTAISQRTRRKSQKSSSQEGTIVSSSTSGTVPNVDGSRRTAERSQQTRPGWRRLNERRLLVGAAAATVLMLLSLMLVFRTTEGTLRVEIDDPQTEVSIPGTAIVLQGTTAQEVSLPSGELRLHVQRGNTQFDTESLELTRGQTIVVEVRLLEEELQVSSGGRVIGTKAFAVSPVRNTVDQPELQASQHVSEASPQAAAPPPAIAPFDEAQARVHQQAWADYLNVPLQFTNSLGMQFTVIPPGRFLMGSLKDDPRHEPDEGPVMVTLTRPYRFGLHEVTQQQWSSVMGSAPWVVGGAPKLGADFPATFVHWHGAVEFCRKLTAQEREAGLISATEEYRLPTDAEWEHACRAGTTTTFSFGDDESLATEYAWFDANAALAGNEYAHPIGQKKPNPWGLYDIHGNVWEWCHDWHGVGLPGGTDPQGPATGRIRVYRGGAWDSVALRDCRSANRHRYHPNHQIPTLGFRVVLSVTEEVPQLTAAAFDAQAAPPDSPSVSPAQIDSLTATEGWSVLNPTAVTSTGRTEFEIRDDGSVLAGTPDPPTDESLVVSASTAGLDLSQITAVRLELLPDDSLPRRGPGRHESGNAQVRELQLRVRRHHTSDFESVTLAGATASYHWHGMYPQYLIDNNLQSRWHVFARPGEPHEAVISLSEPVLLADDEELQIELIHNPNIPLGQFRLSISAQTDAFNKAAERCLVMQLTNPDRKLAAYLHLTGATDQLLSVVERNPDAMAGVVRILESRGAWDESVRVCTEVLNRSPDQLALRAMRAQAYLKLGEWESGRVDWLEVVERNRALAATARTQFATHLRWHESLEFVPVSLETEPENSLAWLSCAPLFLLADDSDGYEEICREMLQRFGTGSDFRVLQHTFKVCLLGHDVIGIEDLPTDEFEAGFNDESLPFLNQSWPWQTRALLALRRGDYEEAIKHLDRSSELNPAPVAAAINHPIRAMSEFRRGNEDESRRLVKESQQQLRQIYHDGQYRLIHDVLMAAILLREAESLILGDPKFDLRQVNPAP